MKPAICFKITLIALVFSFGMAKGQMFTDFSLKNVDGKDVKLSSFSGKKAVAIIFTGNHCVYSKKYDARIVDLAKTYQTQSVQLILINSNDPIANQTESLEMMKERSTTAAYNFPYLQDADQAVSKTFAATRNPHAFLLVPVAGGFNVVYSGLIDDNPLMAEKVVEKHLELAIQAVLAGKNPPKAVTNAVGCGIMGK